MHNFDKPLKQQRNKTKKKKHFSNMKLLSDSYKGNKTLTQASNMV